MTRTPRSARSRCVRPTVSRDAGHGVTAGDFPRSVAAHPVTDDEQAGRRIGMEAVFILLADQPDIRTRSMCDVQRVHGVAYRGIT